MQVTESIDVKDIGEARREQEVGEEGREQVPGVAVQEGRDEVNTWEREKSVQEVVELKRAITERGHHRGYQGTHRWLEEGRDDLARSLVRQFVRYVLI